MYVVNSGFLLNDSYIKSLGDAMVDSFQSFSNLIQKYLAPVFDTSDVMELKAIYRVISFAKIAFHTNIIS